jgi:hypothetical protein
VKTANDAELSAHPSTRKTEENMAPFIELFMKIDLSIRGLGNEIGISFATCQSILIQDLNMHWITAKFMSCLLTEQQKQNHVCA